MSKGPKGQDSTQDLRQETPESPERKEKEQVASLCIAVHLILERFKGHHCPLCQQEGEQQCELCEL